MMIRTSKFLPGVPEDRILSLLASAGGNELESGKLDSPESSAALAVNAFGWFLDRPANLPPFPPLAITPKSFTKPLSMSMRSGGNPTLLAY